MIDSLKKTLHERMTSPFTGSFLVSWLIVNWRFSLALLSSEKYADKMNIYNNLYPSFWRTGVFYFIIFPFLGALFYISLYQLIIAGSTRVWFLVDRAKAWGERSKLLTVKESQKFIIENSELKAENEQLKVSSVEVAEENKRYKQDINAFEKLSGIQITDTLAAQGIMETRKALTQTETEYKNLENASASDRAMLDKKNKELDKALEENEKLIAYERILSDEITSLKEKILEQKEQLEKELGAGKKEMSQNELEKAINKANSNTNAKGMDKVLEFSAACFNGDVDRVNMFLKRGMNVNSRLTNNNTALHIACFNDSAQVIKLLLKNGADVNIKDDTGKTPLDFVPEDSVTYVFLKGRGAKRGIEL